LDNLVKKFVDDGDKGKDKLIFGVSNTLALEVNNALIIRIQQKGSSKNPFLSGLCKNVVQSTQKQM
jgi:hypothetical protein